MASPSRARSIRPISPRSANPAFWLRNLRGPFRLGDVWLAHSRLFGDLKEALVPVEVARATPWLAMPFEPQPYLSIDVPASEGCFRGLD